MPPRSSHGDDTRLRGAPRAEHARTARPAYGEGGDESSSSIVNSSPPGPFVTDGSKIFPEFFPPDRPGFWGGVDGAMSPVRQGASISRFRWGGVRGQAKDRQGTCGHVAPWWQADWTPVTPASARQCHVLVGQLAGWAVVAGAWGPRMPASARSCHHPMGPLALWPVGTLAGGGRCLGPEDARQCHTMPSPHWPVGGLARAHPIRRAGWHAGKNPTPARPAQI